MRESETEYRIDQAAYGTLSGKARELAKEAASRQVGSQSGAVANPHPRRQRTHLLTLNKIINWGLPHMHSKSNNFRKFKEIYIFLLLLFYLATDVGPHSHHGCNSGTYQREKFRDRGVTYDNT